MRKLVLLLCIALLPVDGKAGHPIPLKADSETGQIEGISVLDFHNITVLNLPGGGSGGGTGNVVSLVGDPGTATGLTLTIGGTVQVPTITLGGTLNWGHIDTATANVLPQTAITGLPAALAAKAADSAVIHTTGAETKAGVLTLTSAPVVPSNAFPESAVTSLTTDLAAKQAHSANLDAVAAISGQPYGLGVLAQDTDANARTYFGLGNVDNTSDATKNSAAVSLTNHTIDGRFNSLTHIPTSAIEGWESSTLALSPPDSTQGLVWDTALNSGLGAFRFVGSPTVRGLNKEIWLAVRTDGNAGTGTAEDPYDGSTKTKFEAILASNTKCPTYTTIHLGPGTFTVGEHDTAVTNAKTGWTIIGAGMYATTIQLQQDMSAITYTVAAITGSVNNFTIKDLTIDANYSGIQASMQTANGEKFGALEGIGIAGSNNTIERVRVTNTYGTSANDREHFAISIGSPTATATTGNTIRFCRAESPNGTYGNPFALFGADNTHLMTDSTAEWNVAVGISSSTSSGFNTGGVNGGWLKNCTISHNTFRDCSGAFYCDTGSLENITIDHNTVDMGWAGIMLRAVGTSGGGDDLWTKKNIRITDNNLYIQNRLVGGGSYGINISGAAATNIYVAHNKMKLDGTGGGLAQIWHFYFQPIADSIVEDNTSDDAGYGLNDSPSNVKLRNNRTWTGGQLTAYTGGGGSTFTDNEIDPNAAYQNQTNTFAALQYIIAPKTLDGAMGFQVQLADTAAYNANPQAGIQLAGKYNAAGAYADFGGITASKANATDGNLDGYVAIFTRSNAVGLTEKARFSPSGGFTVGSGVDPGAGFIQVTQGYKSDDGTAGITASTNGIQSKNGLVVANTLGTAAVLAASTLPTLAGDNAFTGDNSSKSLALSGTAGAGFIDLAAQSSAPGTPASNHIRLFDTSANKFGWIGASGYVRTFDGTLTASRAFTLPDADTKFPVFGQTITFTGPTAPRTIALPDIDFTAARTDAANTFTGHQTIEGVTSTGATGTGALVFGINPTLTGATIDSGTLTLSGNQSAAAWTTNGIRLKGISGTLTDTTSSGTVAAAYTNKLGGNTIAASSATTFTDYISSYFSEPTAGSNVTLTNKWGLGADSLYVGTSNPFKVTSAGAVTMASTFTNNNASDATFRVGSNAAVVTIAGGGLKLANGSTVFLDGVGGTTVFKVNPVSTASGIDFSVGGNLTVSGTGAASTSAFKLSGTPFAGTGTTSFPLVYLNDSTATASTTLSTSGTSLGVNAHTGIGNLIDLLLDGTSKFKVTSTGAVTTGGLVTGGGGLDSSNNNVSRIATATWGGSQDAQVSRVAAGGLKVSDSSSNIGYFVQGRNVVAKTSNYTVLTTDSNNFFTNVGASGTVNFTLPTAVAGLSYSFYVDAAQTVQVTAAASTTIQIAGSTSTSAGNITNATQGGCITLVAISTTKWVAASHEGTWAVN